MRGEKQKILEGKAALYHHFPNKTIRFYIGFPFDPTINPTQEKISSFDKPRFLNSIINMTKYFDPNETLIASELWDFLSGQEKTMESLLNIINTIATPSFLFKFQLLCDNTKRLTDEYRTQLKEWNLLSELKLIDNNDVIHQKTFNNYELKKLFNKTAFDNKGNYNYERFLKLIHLIYS